MRKMGKLWWIFWQRYADTKGYERGTLSRTMWAPISGDWVIRAFNQDKHFDEFHHRTSWLEDLLTHPNY